MTFRSCYFPRKYSSKFWSVFNRNPLGRRETMYYLLPHGFLTLFLQECNTASITIFPVPEFLLWIDYSLRKKRWKYKAAYTIFGFFLTCEPFSSCKMRRQVCRTLGICRNNIAYTYCCRRPNTSYWRKKIEVLTTLMQGVANILTHDLLFLLQCLY